MNDPSSTTVPSQSFQRTIRLAPHIRRHFGAQFGGEPCITFRPDGTVRVTVGQQIAELTADQAEAMQHVPA